MPAVPGAGLVVSKPEFGLGRLERVLDGPAPPFHSHQRADWCAGRTPSREVGPLSAGKAAADQEPAGPQPRPGGAIVVGPEVGQLAISPVIRTPADGVGVGSS